ncbi:MAG: outer membrane lipoprotein chaperone LolA [Deltaproteobacteria bacterium]|nr:outer membrane lipoprotein chaperone LolA [Deltaproteobacteria bacterium]
MIFLLPYNAAAADDIDSIIVRVQKVYDGISDMKAGFIQETTSTTLKETQRAEGIVYFKKPNMMRWEYSHPNKDVIVSSGETIWIYQVDLGQVVVSKLSLEDKTLSQHFLSGLGDIKKDFNVKLGEGTNDTYTLILLPKTDLLNIKKIHLIIDKKTAFVKSTKSFDPFGNTASVRFIDASYNVNLKNALFNFDVPKGVRVVTPQ